MLYKLFPIVLVSAALIGAFGPKLLGIEHQKLHYALLLLLMPFFAYTIWATRPGAGEEDGPIETGPSPDPPAGPPAETDKHGK